MYLRPYFANRKTIFLKIYVWVSLTIPATCPKTHGDEDSVMHMQKFRQHNSLTRYEHGTDLFFVLCYYPKNEKSFIPPRIPPSSTSLPTIAIAVTRNGFPVSSRGLHLTITRPGGMTAILVVKTMCTLCS
mmetsp:Transcript_20522/g.29769  ORF Transcript_20522/g.29769 Transcript_20522/m.29769 type:complete len:130 (-) Transcript_20522:1290-1679(-)